MRDFASCFSEHAVKVSDSSCSGGKASVVAPAAGGTVDSSVQTAITTLYRSQLSTHKDLLLKVTWSKTHLGPVLSLGVDDDPYTHLWDPGAVACQLLRKKKGTRSYATGRSAVGIYWDYSAAKFSSGPEPLSNFYAVVVVDAEVALLLGDWSGDFVKRFEEIIHQAKFSLVSRREQVVARAVYSTRARFSDEGKDHDIVIRCSRSGGGQDDDEVPSESAELVVCIDRKRVAQVRRLRWNFRGNQTVFIDGSPVDMMWDVRDWWSSGPQGYAVFMFRKRSALESRLWFEEEVLHRERGIAGFSLLIQAFKSP